MRQSVLFQAIFKDTESCIKKQKQSTKVLQSLQKQCPTAEQRLIIFKNSLKHQKKTQATMKDLYFWFPECRHEDLYGETIIPKTIIENGLDILLYKLLKNKQLSTALD